MPINYTYEDAEAYIRDFKDYKSERGIKNASERRFNEIQAIISKPLVKSMVIKIEWKKSRTWGYNPHAEVWVDYVDSSHDYKSGYTVSGCGYCKTTAVISSILNDLAKQNLINFFDDDSRGEHCKNSHWEGDKRFLPYYSESTYAGDFHNYTCEHYAFGETFDEFHITFKGVKKNDNCL